MHPLAATKPLPRQTQKHKASDAALPAASQFYERRKPASALPRYRRVGRYLQDSRFWLLSKSTIAKKPCSVCPISHRVDGRMTRDSHLTRSSNLSLPSREQGKENSRRGRRCHCPARWKMQEKRCGSCDERPFTCPAHQCRHMADSHHQPRILFTGTLANTERAAQLGMARLICTPFARRRHWSLPSPLAASNAQRFSHSTLSTLSQSMEPQHKKSMASMRCTKTGQCCVVVSSTKLISMSGQAAARAPRARQLRGKLRPPCSSGES